MSGTNTSSLVILFLGMAILFSIISYELKRFTKIPVSISLIVLGIAFEEICPHINLLSDVRMMIIGLDIRVVNYVFLPILIFESCFSANWYTIRKGIWQILVLSTTVAISCAVLNAICLDYIFGYSFEFNQLLIFGLVFSFTDHIAVKSLLKDIHASVKLETLIIGETIFNLAILLMVFEVIQKKSQGLVGFENTMELISRLIFGGLGMGAIFSLSHAFVIRKMLNDVLMETNLTLTVVYLLFWVCQYEKVHVSGSVSLLVYGLFMSVYGKTLISASVENRLRETFEILARNSECILFLIGGIFFAKLSFDKDSLLTSNDIWKVFLIFPLTYAIRGFVLLIHYPLLKRIGHEINFKELFFICFGGIKGVISVSLASIASNNPAFDPHQRFLVIYFGIAIAILSIIFGGIITKVSSKYLNLEKLNEVEEHILIGATNALIDSTNEKILSMKSDENYHLANWERVSESVGCNSLLIRIVEKTYSFKQKLRRGSSRKSIMFLCHSQITITNDQLVVEIRKRYLSTLKGLYWKRFTNGLCTGLTTTVLINSTEACLNRESLPMADWAIVRRSIYNKRMTSLLKKMMNSRIFNKLGRKLLYKKVTLAYNSTLSFIRCHEQTEKMIIECDINYNKKVFQTVMKESHKQVKKCRKFMNMYILDCYPEVVAYVQTKQVEKILLGNQRKIVNKIYEQGLIKEVEFESLIESVDSSIKISTFINNYSMPDFKKTLADRFNSASPEEIEELLSKVKTLEVNPEEKVFEEGEEVRGAYFILRGRVHESSSWVNQELIIGNIVGVQYLIEEYSFKYLSSCSAITSGVLIHIPKDSLSDSCFLQDLYKEAAEELLLLNRCRYQLLNVNESQIKLVVSKSKVINFKNKASKAFKSGALVLKQGEQSKSISWVLMPKPKIRKVYKNSVLLILPKSFQLFFDSYIGDSFNKYVAHKQDDGFEHDFKEFSERFKINVGRTELIKEVSDRSSIDS